MEQYQFSAFGKTLEPTEITIELQSYSSKYMGHATSMRGFRHIMDYIFREYLGDQASMLEMVQQNISVHGGHGQTTVRSWYAVQPGSLKSSDVRMYQYLIGRFHEVRDAYTPIFIQVLIRLLDA